MKVTKSLVEFILINYNQKQLMSKYFRLSINSIEYCLKEPSNKVNNPLREDYTPSLGFLIRDDGRLISKDWANDTYTGDIFDIVSVLTGLNIYKPSEFIKICKYIIDGNIISDTVIYNNIQQINSKSFTAIRFESKPLTSLNIKYLTAGGININHYKVNNYVANRVWIGDLNIPTYEYKTSDPAFVYYFGKYGDEDLIQVYRPFAKYRKNKFKTNCKTIFQAERELYHAETLIIAKSRKDKLAIDSMLIDNNTYVMDVETLGIFSSIGTDISDVPKFCVTSFSSESNRITPQLYKTLKNFYDNIILFTDFDKEGIKNAFYHNVLFNIDYVFLGNNNDIYSEFTSKEIAKYFEKLLLINPNITLFNGMLKSFIEDNRNNYKQKDIFDYTTVNGVDKGELLTNKLFNI